MALSVVVAGSVYLACSVAIPGAARANETSTALLTPPGAAVTEADLPQPLAPAEAARYRRIFRLQEDGRFAAADAEIRQVKDATLLGHVLAQRYLHPHYRARYAELDAWLDRYGDHGEARALHALALRRKPSDAPAPPRPGAVAAPPRGVAHDAADLRPPRAAAVSARGEAIKDEIGRLVRTEPVRAEQLLASVDAAKHLTDADMDEMRLDIAEALFRSGEDARAIAMAERVRGASARPAARWTAALAAWRLGRLDNARAHFEALARTPDIHPSHVAAAAFWAARVHLRSRRPERVNHWLLIAAEHPRTFYGLLARRALGLDTPLNFAAETFDDVDVVLLRDSPAGVRALALLQVAEGERAERELRALAGRGSPEIGRALLALADRANLPALSLQLAAAVPETERGGHDHALYPVPRWAPPTGYTVDRALVFALMRQESGFIPEARSPAGAVGLMQLMPATARAMAQRRGLRIRDVERLEDPVLNVTLGQDYIAYLLGHERIAGNLIMLAAAYNSGPGALVRWQQRSEAGSDPLLFIASIPARETRIFVERVLTAYWFYRMRLRQPVPDLDALAAGEWPIYTAHDSPASQVAGRAPPR